MLDPPHQQLNDRDLCARCRLAGRDLDDEARQLGIRVGEDEARSRRSGSLRASEKRRGWDSPR